MLPRAVGQIARWVISYTMYTPVILRSITQMRTKRKRALKPITKERVQRADMEVVRENIEIARQVIAQEGDAWVARVYQANGLRRPQKKKEVDAMPDYSLAVNITGDSASFQNAAKQAKEFLAQL